MDPIRNLSRFLPTLYYLYPQFSELTRTLYGPYTVIIPHALNRSEFQITPSFQGSQEAVVDNSRFFHTTGPFFATHGSFHRGAIPRLNL